jgi:hypothetical protein
MFKIHAKSNEGKFGVRGRGSDLIQGPSPCQWVEGVIVQSVIEDLDALLAYVEH